MTLIETLLSLPEDGEPKVVSRKAAAALTGASPKMVVRHGTLCSLTDGGRRFLVQFRHVQPAIVSHIVVRLVIEDNAPAFHLLCDETRLLKVHKTDLRHSLQELQAANPGVKVVFDFRSSGNVS